MIRWTIGAASVGLGLAVGSVLGAVIVSATLIPL